MHEIAIQRSARDLLESIFKVATALVRGERASLLLRRDSADTHFIMAMAQGIAEEVRKEVRVREGEGIAGRVAQTKQALLVRGREESPALVSGRYRSDSFVSVPIVVNDRAQGVLSVADRLDGQPFDTTDLETLRVLADHIATCLVQQRRDEQLIELAETDALTQLYNRRHFDQRLEAESRRAQRTGEPLSLLMIDVNAFKEINDVLGHREGDEVLRLVAEAMRRTVRAYDVPVRFGGDEFAVLLPSADTASATRAAERILSSVASSLPKHVLVAVPRVGLSIGVTSMPTAPDGKALVDQADAAMYLAKDVGGGVEAWRSDTPTMLGQTRRRATFPAPYLSDPARLANPELQRLVPTTLAEEWNVLVIGREGSVLTVVMPEPSNAAIEALSAATGMAIYPVYGSPDEIEAARRAIPS